MSTERKTQRKGIMRRLRVRGRSWMQRALGQRDSPGRVARGAAAGFFVAAFPLPGLQVPLSLLAGWVVRGNLVVAVIPQMISNALTMIPLAVLQYQIGATLWPSTTRTQEAVDAVKAVAGSWNWTAVGESLRALADALGTLGAHTLGPLALGVLLTGTIMAAVSYGLTLYAVRAWQRRRRQRWLLEHAPGAAPVMALPPPEEPEPPFWRRMLRYADDPHRFLCANSVKLLVDGQEAYPEMLAAIDGAKRTVDLETYILRADRTGARFQRALVAAGRRGVKVRLLYDYVGCLLLPSEYVQRLLDSRVEVRVYHPLLLTRPTWAINRRDHRKTLIVDGRTVFTGGLNIADEYAAREDGGGGWRDTHMRLDGETSAAAATNLFEYGWAKATEYRESGSARDQLRSSMRRGLERAIGITPPCRQVGADGCPAGGVAAEILGNQEFNRRRHIRRAYLRAIRDARRYVLIENAYFIPDHGIRQALADAVRRGVLVAVAVARDNDVQAAAYASRHLYTELLTSGVRVFEWPLGMLHAKTAVIDDTWAIVGSYNFDHRSLVHQLESVAVVLDAPFARRLRDQTLADMARCHEVSLKEHTARPWTQKALQFLAYMVRSWL